MIAGIPLHPGNPRKGVRVLKTNDEFYVQDEIEKDTYYRLMHLFNFCNNEFVSKDVDKLLNARMIHWLPVSSGLVKIEVLMDDGSLKNGLAEAGIKKVKINEVIQLERNFFARCDKKMKGKMVFVYGHQ